MAEEIKRKECIFCQVNIILLSSLVTLEAIVDITYLKYCVPVV